MQMVTAPILPGMQGKYVANLQSTLLMLFKQNILVLVPEQVELIERYMDRELHGSVYGQATTELVRALQLQYHLEDVGEVDEDTAEAINSILKEFTSKVEGIIKNQYEDEGPAAGFIVKAFDKDLRSEEFLGQTITDQDGKYEITFSKQQFRRAEKKTADILIRIFAEDNSEQVLAESSILFNAPKVAMIDLTLESKLSEYERLLNMYLSLNREEDVLPMDLTEKDIAFLAHESGFEADILRVFVAARINAVKYFLEPELPNGGPLDTTAFFYALGRKRESLKITKLLDRDFDELRNELNEAIADKIIPSCLAGGMDEFFKSLKLLVRETSGNGRI